MAFFAHPWFNRPTSWHEAREIQRRAREAGPLPTPPKEPESATGEATPGDRIHEDDESHRR